MRSDLWSALAAVCVMACGGKTLGEGSDGGPGSSSSSGGGSADTFSCLSADMSECISAPTGLGGSCPLDTTSVSSCPSSNQLGCCSLSGMVSNGQTATVTSCYYCAGPFMAGSASKISMACNAASAANPKWTAGDVTSCGDGG